MYHKDGIRVHLEAKGNEIKELAHLNGQGPADTEWNDTRAIIRAKFHTPFTVVLELTEDFRLFSAEGLKLTVAIGHHHQTPGELVDVQAFHIPLNKISKSRFEISEHWCWGADSSEPLISEIRIPAPEGRPTDPLRHVATY